MPDKQSATTPEFRVNFPVLFTPRKNDLNEKLEFSVQALFPKNADLAALKRAAHEAGVKKWGADPSKWPRNLRSPFRNQSDLVTNDGKQKAATEPGAIYMNFRTTQKPAVVDAQVVGVSDPSIVYSGCYAKAHVRAYAYDMKGNKGIAFGLQMLQKTRDGEHLAGRPDPESCFSPIVQDMGESDEPELAGMF